MTKSKSSKPPTPGARSQQVEAIVAQLRAMGTEESRAGMARFAIRTEQAFGVSVYDLRKVARSIGTDHELALALWGTGNHEARLLACFIDEPSKVSAKQMDAWATEFDSWDICDQATTSLFDLTGHAWDKAVAWAVREEEWVKRGGFALMAGLAVHDKTADDAWFVRLLVLVRQEARDDRNFVKKAVNWALRNIGKRNLVLNAAAIECAEGILDGANRAAGAPRGGDAGVRAARWIATDALRELRSEAVQARLRKRGKAGS